ncbi:MAG: c-type cytochrome [Thermoanaerobaculia bacterium]
MPEPSRRPGLLVKLLALVGLATLVGLALAYYGFIDVAATRPEPKFVAGFFHEVMEHSVERRARAAVERGELVVPDLADPARRRRGLEEYVEMCVTCHGAPGIRASAAGQGLNPPVTDLVKDPSEPAEAFWVVKHGIRMTGMPAFGPTHDDETLWDIVAFLDELPRLDAAGYAERVRQRGLDTAGAGHEAAPHEHAGEEHGPPGGRS